MKTIDMPEDVKDYFAAGTIRIKKVNANDDYTLTVHFDNGETKLYDMSDMLYGVFEVLKDKAKFEEVFIDEVGNIAWDVDKNRDSGIYWSNRIDLCADSVYLKSRQITSQS